MQNAISGAMLLLKLASLYFLVVALFALKKPKPIPRANPNMRFACVIAARNEERVIGGLIESLLRQTYPKALFDIYVMPNNCTDHTALAAIRAGAQVLRPEGEIRCKGDALHEAVAWLLPQRTGSKQRKIFAPAQRASASVSSVQLLGITKIS